MASNAKGFQLVEVQIKTFDQIREFSKKDNCSPSWLIDVILTMWVEMRKNKDAFESNAKRAAEAKAWSDSEAGK